MLQFFDTTLAFFLLPRLRLILENASTQNFSSVSLPHPKTKQNEKQQQQNILKTDH